MSYDAKTDVNCRIFPKVAILDRLSLEDGPPNMLGVATDSISYDFATSMSSDFKDVVAFPTSDFTEETKSLSEMAVLLEQGKEFSCLLYTFRSASKALPMVQTSTPENLRKEIHEKTFEILRPQILRLKDFMDFCERAVQIVRKNVNVLIKPEQKKSVQSEAMLDLVIKCINMLLVLDALKDMKACLLNDFSRYKRSFSPIRSELPNSDAIGEEIHALQMFLGNPAQPNNLIMFNLQTDLHKLADYEVVVGMLIEHCVQTIKDQRYLLPDEQHMYLRMIPYLLYLFDGKKTGTKGDKGVFINAFKHKLVDISKLAKLMKDHPVIPLYQDMQIQVLYVLRRCKHWNDEDMSSKWSNSDTTKIKRSYMLVQKHPAIRAAYMRLTGEFTALLNEIQEYQKSKTTVPPEILERSYTLMLECMKALTSWQSSIKSQSAYKYANPCSLEMFAADAKLDMKTAMDEYMKINDYQKVVKSNYTNEELYALVDVIAMIKGLASSLLKNQLVALPLAMRYIHDETQVFLQQEVVRPLRKAHKRNRGVQETMLQMRDIGGDWSDIESRMDYKQKKKVLVSSHVNFPRRSVPPTLTQMALIRRMMKSIMDPRAEGMKGGMFTEKDLKSENVEIWKKFYATSYYFRYFLNFSETVKEIMDMSHLWFREFYLEMTKCVQFPIYMSMPWILTEFLINTPTMKENIFFPMDMYNDAARQALMVMNQQFLYDEVEAECNLSFDSLIYQVSGDIFKYFKTVASSVLIDKPYRRKLWNLKNLKSKGLATVVSSRYAALMKQRHISLLGRSIDLQMLISQHCNSYIRQNLDIVIRRLESADLTNVVGFKFLLDNIRLVHELLSEFLNLDPFTDVYNELNDNVSVGQFRGRVVWHIFSELVGDVMPNFVYNSTTNRFVRQELSFAPEMTREKNPSDAQSFFWHGRGFRDAYSRLNAGYKGYFGVEHIEAILDVLEDTDIPMIIYECVNDIGNKLVYDFDPFFQVLMDVIPGMKLPQQMGSIGGFSYFELHLANNHITSYAGLRSGVFQCLREVGNTLAFLQLLESIITVRSNFHQTHRNFFLGITVPAADYGPVSRSNDNAEHKESAFLEPENKNMFVEAVYDSMNLLNNSGYENKQVSDQSVVRDIIGLSQRCMDLYAFDVTMKSVFRKALMNIKNSIEGIASQWLGPPPTGDKLMETEHPKDILRCISVLQFIFCLGPDEKSEPPNIHDPSVFGEGFNWAICLIVHILGLRHRFEVMDFTYHTIRLSLLHPLPEYDEKSKKKMSAQAKLELELSGGLRAFLQSARLVRSTNNRIFSCLESFLSPPPPGDFNIYPPTDVYDEKKHIVAGRDGFVQAGQGAKAPVGFAQKRMDQEEARQAGPPPSGGPPSGPPSSGGPPPGPPKPSGPPPPSSSGPPPPGPPPSGGPPPGPPKPSCPPPSGPPPSSGPPRPPGPPPSGMPPPGPPPSGGPPPGPPKPSGPPPSGPPPSSGPPRPPGPPPSGMPPPGPPPSGGPPPGPPKPSGPPPSGPPRPPGPPPSGMPPPGPPPSGPPPSGPPRPPSSGGGRGNLLASIQAGKKLKKGPPPPR